MRASIAWIVPVVVAAVSLFPLSSEACTNPENGAEQPTVDEGGGGAGMGTEMPPPSGGVTEGTAQPLILSETVRLSWTPASERDGDPNNSVFYSHTGHRIATRVQISDQDTGKIVLEETLPQYDYANAQLGVVNPAITSFVAHLDSGRYIARVQSVFTRHDETRYGMEGTWVRTSTITEAPAMSAQTASIRFALRSEPGAIQGTCSIAPLAQGLPLLALLLLIEKRRQQKR